MIKYALSCDGQHNWDAWFPSISGYDDQLTRGLIECPFCASKSVGKAPMAPSVQTSRSKVQQPPEMVATSETTNLPVASQVPDLSMPEPLKALLSEIKERIEKTHEYVGDTFAREVRAMHDGDTDERPIYGEATAKEITALIEDDIPIAPLPLMGNPRGVKGVH
jgi:hypothetical protein